MDGALLPFQFVTNGRSLMSVNFYRQQVDRHRREIVSLTKKKADESAKASEYAKRTSDAANAAGRASSLSARQSKLREASRHETTYLAHQKKASDLEAKIAAVEKKLSDDQTRLRSAEEREQRRDDQARLQATRESQRIQRGMTNKLSQHEHLHRVAFAAIAKLENLPERITILFLASNPID